jgi:hypothetical protein
MPGGGLPSFIVSARLPSACSLSIIITGFDICKLGSYTSRGYHHQQAAIQSPVVSCMIVTASLRQIARSPSGMHTDVRQAVSPRRFLPLAGLPSCGLGRVQVESGLYASKCRISSGLLAAVQATRTHQVRPGLVDSYLMTLLFKIPRLRARMVGVFYAVGR